MAGGLSIWSLSPLAAQQVDVWSRPIQVERSRSLDFLHYRVSLKFDLDTKVFWGENEITLTPLGDDVDRCVLDAEEIVVTGAVDEAGRELRYVQGDTSVVIAFGRTLAYGDTITLSVAFRGDNPQEGFFFDDATDDHPQMVSTDSWPDEAHHWIPLYDYPNDKVTHELIVTVSEGNRVLSNGRLVGVAEDEGAGTTTWHWSQEQPHATYLMMLAIGPFTVIEDSLGSLPVNYWVYPEDAEDARWIFAKTPRMIAFYADLFDHPYPWAKYDQVTTPHVGGGAEATSATILGDGVIHDRRAEQDFSWERVIAHEVAHQWWGNLITLREWSHTWLNESFGTYSDYLWTRHESGEDEGAWALLGKKNAYLREAHTRYMRPIVFNRYERPHDNFDSHTYPKGACILHQLRFILGEEPFFRVLGAFLDEYAFEPVDTYDFMKTVNEVTGQNMDWFFEQYIFSPGHPVFEISSSWDAGDGQIRLRVAQLQDRDHGVPIYRTPVQVGIVTASGKTVQKVWLENEEDVFVFQSTEEPLLVRFDEGNWLLKEWTYDKSVEELLYQARHDDVIGREWAVRELGRSGSDARVGEELALIAGEDPFWAVRLAAIETIAAADGQAAIEPLQTAATDANSQVRRAAIRILGGMGDQAMVPFFRSRFEADDSYQVQAEALRAIGRSGDRSQLGFLRQASEMPSYRDVVRRAAIWAIEKLAGGR
ncbi:MAG: aminopeptidase [Gemmatimonadales bacterium]|nr:aminopeptidase [Gemmatimonadales bacterium]